MAPAARTGTAMAETLCRVTVVGERRRVDLALPASDPIAEFVPQLVRMCGQPLEDTLPAAWSLALVRAMLMTLDSQSNSVTMTSLTSVSGGAS